MRHYRTLALLLAVAIPFVGASLPARALAGGPGPAGTAIFQAFGGQPPNSSGTAGQFLQTNGAGVLTWATAGGGGGTLAATLALGNTTGANNLIVSTTQYITAADSLDLYGAPPTGGTVSGNSSHIQLFNGSASGGGGQLGIFAGSAVAGVSNKQGSSLVLSDGPGTGNAADLGINFECGVKGSSGTSAQSSVTEMFILGADRNLSGQVATVAITPAWDDLGLTSSTIADTLSLTPTVNYHAASKTGRYEAIFVNVTETSLPSGQNYLLRMQAGASGGTDEFAVTNTGKILAYAGVTTAGLGVPGIYAQANITGQTTNATITSYANPAADADFEVSGQMSVTASTTLATTITCTYTDVASVARTMILPIQPLTGTFTAAGAISGAGASIWETPVMHIRAKASTTITLLTSAGTFSGVTYSASGVIKKTS